MKVIEELAILWWNKSIEEWKHYIRPRISENTEKVVFEQLHKSLSIYDDSWIFLEFKNKFAKYHSMEYWVLYNSWTSALYAMFRAIGLSQSDEIIVPVYTFFATASPIIYTSAKIKFCDCDLSGNVDPIELEKSITNKTKAVIVTHMRWIPCDMDKITEICKKYNIILLEDCSHAHWAEFNWKKVWSFWDISIRSLQWQKIITWWEWWILLTNNEELYKRALFAGHYNKICKQASNEKDDLFKYWLTWFWLKLRAHPLAIAIANEQFDKLDEILYQKQNYVTLIQKSLSKYSFLEFPNTKSKKPSWYALIIKYNEKKANNISIESFAKALFAEWLNEVDIPKSTGLINNLDLFYDAHKLWLSANSDIKNDNLNYENASNFYNNCIKLPVRWYADDENTVNKYIQWIEKVCWYIENKPELFNFKL